jgi:F-type H+-transporting ATPase subunit delta
MSENTTVARPYSKAIFEHALASANLAEWSNMLLGLAQIVRSAQAMEFINNPATTAQQHIQLLLSVMSPYVNTKEEESIHNVITLLAENKRLMLLPDILVIYEALRAEQEKTLEAKVLSYSALTSAQQEKLAQSLSERLQRKVSIEVSIDPSILGGVKISAGDLVIDGSIRGQLNKLGAALA